MYMIERQHQILQFIRQHKVVKLVTLTKSLMFQWRRSVAMSNS